MTRAMMVRAVVTAAAVGGALAAGAVPAAAGSGPVPPEHAKVICESASFYPLYDHAAGRPVGKPRTLFQGDKIGHTRGSHPVYNGWAAAMDFGPNDWGYLRYECIGKWRSW
ncbi:hypothetical protein OHR68_33865 [Spirillospora sp. NBC_00431]